MTGDGELPRTLARDHRTAPLSAADRAMLDYAVKLTLHPAEVGDGDVEALRSHGFSDTAILDICQVTAYYNYVNRLADGLGVELEDHWDRDDPMTGRDASRGERSAEGRGAR